MSATPNPEGDRRKGYPTEPGKYADPQDKAYPLDTLKHIRNAATRLAQYGERYSKEKRDDIKHRIEEAERKHGIGKYRDASKAQAAPSELEDVLEILRVAFEDDGPAQETKDALVILKQALESEENPRTSAQQQLSDAMVDSFMREVREHDYGRA